MVCVLTEELILIAKLLDRRRSLTCYAFTLSGSVISWKATLQSTVASSTTEADYIAVTEAVKEVIWLRDLVEDSA